MECSVFKPTNDNWFPAYELSDGDKLVKVSFIEADDKWRVCAWGDDDFGMGKDFDQENNAWCCFLEIIGSDTVNISDLKTIWEFTSE